MGETDVAIGESELNLIGEYVQNHLSDWMERLGVRAAVDPVTNTQLLERVVRVEEGLKTGQEVMGARFEAMDKRFEDLKANINARFEAIDRRFEDQKENFNKRFGLLTWMMGAIMAIVVAVLGVLLV